MGGRVAEGARLESVLWLKPYEGSNPSSSANIQLRTESLIGFSKFIYAVLSPVFAGFPTICIFLCTVLYPLQKSKILAKNALFSLRFSDSSVLHRKWYISRNSGFADFPSNFYLADPKGTFVLFANLFR